MREGSLKAALVASALRLPTAAVAQARVAPSLESRSNLPFAAPRFDILKDSDFGPALEACIVTDAKEAEAIAND